MPINSPHIPQFRRAAARLPVPTWKAMIVLAAALLALLAPPARGQWERFPVSGARAPGGAADASVPIRPSVAEPSLAAARGNARTLQELLNANATVAFSVPGDYYIADPTSDGQHGVVIPSNRVLYLAPGVRLIRHSGYSHTSAGLGWALGFVETTTTSNVVIYGGGAIGRAAASGSDDQHTVNFTNWSNLVVDDITFFTYGSAKYCIISNNGVKGRFNIHFSGDLNNDDNTFVNGWAANSDGLHLTGYHSDIRVLASGSTGDNMVAAGSEEGAGYPYFGPNMKKGSILGLVIERLRFDRSAEPYRQFANNIDLSFSDGSFNATTLRLTKTGIGTGRRLDGSEITFSGGTNVITTRPFIIKRQIDDNTLEFFESIATSGSPANVAATTAAIKPVIDCRILDAEGSLMPLANAAIAVIDDGGGPLVGGRHDLRVDRLRVRNGAAGIYLVKLASTGLRRVCLSNVDVPENSPGVVCGSASTAITGMEELRIERMRSTQLTGAAHMIQLINCAPQALVINDCELVTGAGSVCHFALLDGGTSTLTTYPRVTGSNNIFRGSSTGSFLFLGGNGSGQISYGHFSNCHVDGVGRLCTGPVNSAPSVNTRSRVTFTGLTMLNLTTEALAGQVDASFTDWWRIQASTFPWVRSNSTEYPSASFTPEWRVFTLNGTDLAGLSASGANNLDLSSLTRYGNLAKMTRGIVCEAVSFERWTVFTGPTTCTIDAGVSGAANQFGGAQNLLAGAGKTVATPTDANKWVLDNADPSLAVRVTNGSAVAPTGGTVVVGFLLGGGIAGTH